MARLGGLLPAIVLLLCSCGAFAIEREQVLLRYRAETDVLDALLVCEGIGALEVPFKKEADEIEQAVQALQAMRAGRRYFKLGPLELDLDQELELDAVAGSSDPYLALGQRLQALLPGIELLEARILIDPEKGLCLVQRIRMREASAWLRLLDATINQSLLEGQYDDDMHKSLAEDPRTLELLRTRAQQGGSWARFDGGALAVSIPMTTASAARLLKKTLAAVAASEEVEEGSLADLLAPLSSIEVSGEELRLTFSPAEDGWMRCAIGKTSGSAPESVSAALGKIEPIRGGNLDGEVERWKLLD